MSWLFPKYGYSPQQSSETAGLGASILIHGVVLAAVVLGFAHRDQIEELARPITVSLIEAAKPQPEKPAPPPPKSKAPQPKLPPMPVATTVAEGPTHAPSGVIAPVTPPMASPAPAPVAVEVPALVEARFDADYLSNPKPVYPMVSRRMGEAGTVFLRVQVSADGHALQIELKKTSGFARLDQSALDTVTNWKFVPAKRGGTPVISWVVVPIVFSLS